MSALITRAPSTWTRRRHTDLDTHANRQDNAVFAPSDEAFAQLPDGTVDSLLAEPDKLAEVLTYHVVAGRVTAADVVGLTTAPTVQGEELRVSVDGRVQSFLVLRGTPHEFAAPRRSGNRVAGQRNSRRPGTRLTRAAFAPPSQAPGPFR